MFLFPQAEKEEQQAQIEAKAPREEYQQDWANDAIPPPAPAPVTDVSI